MPRPVVLPAAVVRGRTRRPVASGLRRERLLDRFSATGDPRLALVVAPAGCGKTTLMGHVAEAAAPRAAWLTLDEELVTPGALLAHLRESASHIAGFHPRRWGSVDDALHDLETGLPAASVLVLDEVHSVADGAALDILRSLLRHQPPRLALVLGGRRLPDLGLARHRLAGATVDLGAGDLRFRTWEVEELFRTCHDVRLRAQEVPALAQRTGGWAAGLQLFHLATAGRPPSARARLLSGGGAGRLTGEYLAEQVLEQLDPRLRDVVLRTSVLTRLSPQRCDALLDVTGSGEELAELRRLGLLDVVDPGPSASDGTVEHRYHDVLQTHLLEQLETRLGMPAARELHRRAARLWTAERAPAEAVRSSSRAQDWAAVRAVIVVAGADLAQDPGSWLDLLPPGLLDGDPWVALAKARRLLADGSLDAALVAYERAVELFGPLGGLRAATRENSALRGWLEPPLGTVDDPVHLLRRALSTPQEVPAAGPADGAPRWCAHATALLVTGRPRGAAQAFAQAVSCGADGPWEVLALLGAAAALTLAADPSAGAARRLAAAAAAASEVAVVERLAEGLVRLVAPGAEVQTRDLVARCRAAGDVWGEALLGLLAGVVDVGRGRHGPEVAGQVTRSVRVLSAPALVVWAELVEASAADRAAEPWEPERLVALGRSARQVGPVPHAAALLLRTRVPPDHSSSATPPRGAASLGEGTEIAAWLARLAPGASDGTTVRAPGGEPSDRLRGRGRGRTRLPTQRDDTVRPPAVTDVGRTSVQVLGGFGLTRDGVPLPLDQLRPRHRDLLALLCSRSGQVVRRDELVESFWPSAEPDRAQHSLQVAVSELRRLLERPGGDGGVRLRREGVGYRLLLDRETDSDAGRLLLLVASACPRTTAAGPARDEALQAVVGAYPGELLPHVGSPDWVLADRERLRCLVVAAHEELAGLHQAAGRDAEVVVVARAGLALEPASDVLWRALIAALDRGDEPVAAAGARRGYAAVLADLGVAGPVPARPRGPGRVAGDAPVTRP